MGTCTKLYSDRVKEKLLQISDRSVVARKLLEFTNRDLTAEYTRNADIDEQGNFSILPKGKDCIEVNDGVNQLFYHPKNRIAIRPGAFIRTWANEFLIIFSDVDIEAFVNMFTASKADIDKLGFKLVEGKDIITYYHSSSHAGNGDSIGTLSKSCMRDSAQTPLIKFYALNPHRINLLILFADKSAKIIGRAVVWKLHSGKTFMDRIYGSDTTQELFKKYCLSLDWYFKESQSQNTSKMIGPDGKHISMETEYVTDLNIQFEQMPYFDTFHSCYPNLRILGTHRNLFGGMDYFGTYQTTAGQAKDKNGLLIQTKNLYLNAEVQPGYINYAEHERGNKLNYLKKEMFQDAANKQFFHLSNVVFGPTGKTYVKDNPLIVFLTGEPFIGYVPRSETSTCASNGLVYITKMHVWVTVDLTTKAGKRLNLLVMENNLDGFLKQLGDLVFKRERDKVVLTGVDDLKYAPLVIQETASKKNLIAGIWA